MNKNWLEVVMPASLAIVACAIGLCVLTLGGLLQKEPAMTEQLVYDKALVDSVEASGYLAEGATTGDPAAIAAGDALFKGNCAQCHALHDVVVGPALAGITKRRSISWLIPWVKNSTKVVASGDDYAVKIFNQYQKQQMPSFQLSDDEITSIIAYVDQGASYAPMVAYDR